MVANGRYVMVQYGPSWSLMIANESKGTVVVRPLYYIMLHSELVEALQEPAYAVRFDFTLHGGVIFV